MRKILLLSLTMLASVWTWAQNEPITQIPDGQEITYTRAGKSFYPQRYGEDTYIYEGNQGGAMTVVFAANNEVYIKDPVYGYKHDTYVKGTLAADGKSIVITLPQVLFIDTDIPILLGVGKYDDEKKEYNMDTSITSVVYQIEGDNETITLVGPEKMAPLGDFWGDDKSFAGRGEWNTVLTKYKEKNETTSLPDGLTPDTMPLGGADWTTGKAVDVNNEIKVAISGIDIYVQGLAPVMPEAWVHGTIKDDVATFPVQFLGFDADKRKHYLAGLSGDGLNMAPFSMLYDAELNSYWSESRLIVNTSDLNYDSESVISYFTGIYIGNRPEAVTLPEGLTVVEMPYEGTADNGEKKTPTAGILKMAIDGEDVYVQGLVSSVPEGWIKGSFNDLHTDVFFPFGQYVGYDAYGNVYAVGDKYDMRDLIDITESVDDVNDVRLSFDNEKNTFKLMNNFYISRKDDEIDRGNLLRAGLSINDGSFWVAARQGYENAADVANIIIGESVQGVLDKNEGTNAPKYYAKGEALRMYAGNKLTISSTDKVIGKIAFLFDDADKTPMLDAEDGTFTINGNMGIWQGDANEVVFNVPNASANQARIKTIMVFFFDYSSSLVTVPADLATEPYQLTAKVSAGFFGTEEKTLVVNVGFRGNDVYFQGLSEKVPDAWVKGKLADGKITIPEWYLGLYSAYEGLFTYEMQFGGVELVYNEQAGEFTTDGYKTMDANPISEDFAELESFTEVRMVKMAEVAATPKDPTVTKFVGLGSERYVSFNIPVVGKNGEGIFTNKLSYAVWLNRNGEHVQLTFAKDLYVGLSEDMSEIPYLFTDKNNISHSRIDLLQEESELRNWSKIGLQSIYRGAGQENKSEILWFDLDKYWADGILDVCAEEPTVVYFDLQGRVADESTKGLLIKQMRMPNGTFKAVKVLCK